MTHCQIIQWENLWWYKNLKNGWTDVKICMMTNFVSKNWNMTFIFQNDNVFIKYSWKCHVVTLVSNNVVESWNSVWWLSLGLRIEIWCLFFKMTTSSLNIHRNMTYCHFGVKQRRRKLKFGMMTKCGSKNWNMTIIFQNDVFIKYS